MFMFWLNNRNK
ncbi:hypothetical protein MI474_11905 [Staphylococcus epidermidis]|nr:hypothetical protein [Staphylococcus epidermidis]MEB6251490.1 hypothetical protein [Staphylococcus epidermidis]UIY39600.1 hypothetical protein KB225_11570 [Staphylococcus epidermidis]